MLLQLLLLLPLVLAKRQPGDNRPNFVFFLPDETRAEALGTYGHPITKTPHYDRLASEGTLFKQAHVLHTQCSPSRCALTTGWYLHTLGHRTQTHLIQSWEPNMFKYLKQANYTVMWWGKNDMLAVDSWNESVTYWEADVGVADGRNAFKFGEAGYWSFLHTPSKFNGKSHHNKDYLAVVKANYFMNHDPPEPFMIFLPGKGSHPPYGAPSDWYDVYDPNEIKKKAPLRPAGIKGKPRYHSLTDGIPKYRNLTYLPSETFYKINSVYLGRVSYTDWILGQLLDGIDQSGLRDRTAVFVTSDHGDFAGDYNLVEKWPGGVDDILTRVPLIARIPGGAAGHVVDTPVNQFDIMPTILEMAGVIPNHTHFAVSFLEQLKGKPGVKNRTVYSEGGYYWYNEMEPHDPTQQRGVHDPHNMYYPRYQEELSHYPDGSPRVIMARTADWKLVWRPRGVSEFYDLTKDPQELNNVYNVATYKTIRDKMEHDMLYWLTQTSDVTPLHYDPRGLPKPPKYPFGPKPPPGLDTEMLEEGEEDYEEPDQFQDL